MKKLLSYLLVLAIGLMMSCTSEDDAKEKELFKNLVNKTKGTEISIEELSEIINSIPSPIEVSSIIQENENKFHESFLNPTSNEDDYKSEYKQSVNLGIYSSDMGYLNIYEETILSFKYLTTVRSLSEELDVDQFFDIETIKRLSENSENIDSLIYLSTSSFDKMSKYLRSKDRVYVSALILVGGWIESQFILTQIAKDKNSKELNDRIGEQKVPLEKINILVDAYENVPEISELVNGVRELAKAYEGVEIIVTKGGTEEVFNEETGMLEITDKSTSEVKITDEQLAEIVKITEKIRNKLIN